MAKPKEPYNVYARFYTETENDGTIFHDWEMMGKTWAVSEAQAINNVRHNTLGDYGASQYKPIAVSCHWESGFQWKAIRAGDGHA